MDHEPTHSRGRDTVLTLSLVILLGGTTVVLLVFVSLGVFAYVLLAMLALLAVGYVHYVLWGFAMSQQTAGEREELTLREEMDNDAASRRRRASIQDLSRRRPHDG